MRLSLIRPALERRALGIAGARWKLSPGAGTRRPALWSAQIAAFVAGRAPLDTVHVSPVDDVQAALDATIAAAAARPGTATPLTHRARLVFAEGIYPQGLTFVAARAARVGVELVGQNSAIRPIGDAAALEHCGVTCLISGMRFEKRDGSAPAVHGSGLAGETHEMVVHDSVIEATNGAHAFSHELGANHLLYAAGVTVRGPVYQHTIQSAVTGPSVAIWDDCDTEMGDVADESVHAGDKLFIRSGRISSRDFAATFQRSGSPLSPRIRIVVDPSSGVQRVAGRLAEFGDPDVEGFPILDANARMLAAWT